MRGGTQKQLAREGQSARLQADRAAARAAQAGAYAAVQAPQLRASTRARVEVAKEERVRQEQARPCRCCPTGIASPGPRAGSDLDMVGSTSSHQHGGFDGAAST